MIAKDIYRRLGIWLIVSVFFFFIAYPQWDVAGREVGTIFSVVLFASLLGLRVLIKFKPVFDAKVNYSKTLVSSDGFVTATIEEIDLGTVSRYIGRVRRNYQDGVYAKEEQFDSLAKAEQWLQVVYDKELARHQKRLLAISSQFYNFSPH